MGGKYLWRWGGGGVCGGNYKGEYYTRNMCTYPRRTRKKSSMGTGSRSGLNKSLAVVRRRGEKKKKEVERGGRGQEETGVMFQ